MEKSLLAKKRNLRFENAYFALDILKFYFERQASGNISPNPQTKQYSIFPMNFGFCLYQKEE